MEPIPLKNTVSWFRDLSHTDDTCTAMKYCRPAARILKRRLRSEEYNIDEIDELSYAAAAMAYARYVMTDDCGQYSDLKTGDITISYDTDGQLSRAQRLLQQALLQAAPYLRAGIRFKSIGGEKIG